MLYGIQTGFGSPQVPVAELLARPVPTLLSPQNQRQKSSNFLQVPDMEAPRPKSVPSSPMVKRAFSRLGTITAGWGRSIRKQNTNQLNVDDKKKWSSTHDCSSEFLLMRLMHLPPCLFCIQKHLPQSLFVSCANSQTIYYFQIKTARTETRTNPRVNWPCHGCRCVRMHRRWTALN